MKFNVPHQIASCKERILPALITEIYWSKVDALIFFVMLSYLTRDPTPRQPQVAEEEDTGTPPNTFVHCQSVESKCQTC